MAAYRTLEQRRKESADRIKFKEIRRLKRICLLEAIAKENTTGEVGAVRGESTTGYVKEIDRWQFQVCR